MNIDKILSDEYYTFLENNHNVAFYSLSIGLEEYFETYHQVCVYLSEYERDDKEKINYKAEKNGIGYIKSYLNIAIHIQHFFELETKRLLEKEHKFKKTVKRGQRITCLNATLRMDRQIAKFDNKRHLSPGIVIYRKAKRRLMNQGL